MTEAHVPTVRADTTVHSNNHAHGNGVARVRLTEVEFGVLVALSNGLQSKEIARDQRRSVATIESCIRVLCAKLDARTRTHLVAQAFRAGVLHVD